MKYEYGRVFIDRDFSFCKVPQLDGISSCRNPVLDRPPQDLTGGLFELQIRLNILNIYIEAETFVVALIFISYL